MWETSRTEINFRAGIPRTGISNGIVAQPDTCTLTWTAGCSTSQILLYFLGQRIHIRRTDIRSLIHLLGMTACRRTVEIAAWTSILPMVTMSTAKPESASPFQTQPTPMVMEFSIQEAVSV